MKRFDRRALFATGAAAALLAATGTSAAGQPRRGGNLRIALPREGDLLSKVARAALGHQLTEVAPDGVLRGELAAHWRSDDTAQTWRFDLRSGVAFHDGRPVLAEDVVASLEAHISAGRLDIASLRNMEALTSESLVFRLEDANPHLPYLLADSGLGIAPDGAVDAPLATQVGAGLYRTERAQDGRHFRAQRVDTHFRDGRAGWVDTLELIVISDPGVRAEALRDGYVDVAALPLAREMVGRGSFQYHPSEGDMALAAAAHVALPHRISTRAPLDDLRIAERWWMV